MAEILRFAKGEPGRKRAPGGTTGVVVIFPGIRVEYHDHPKAPARKARPRRRRAAKDAASA